MILHEPPRKFLAKFDWEIASRIIGFDFFLLLFLHIFFLYNDLSHTGAQLINSQMKSANFCVLGMP